MYIIKSACIFKIVNLTLQVFEKKHHYKFNVTSQRTIEFMWTQIPGILNNEIKCMRNSACLYRPTKTCMLHNIPQYPLTIPTHIL